MSLLANAPIVAYRGIHLDLKGTPPTIDRLCGLLKLIAASGYNAVLVEWEDMFPWTVDIRFRCETAYSDADVKQFHEHAASLGIEVIPLVQCLGHFETPLSVPGYEHLREIPHRPDVLNPLADGARELVQNMVNDVLRLTPNCRYLHLGGDEAWTFGSHPDTKAYIEQHSAEALYLQHINPILDALNARHVRPILWHDMMRHWSDDSLKALAQKADLCAWGYCGHPDHTEHHFNTKYVQRFRDNGITCWGGAAYKGADGPNIDIPDYDKRQENALAWADIAQRYDFVGLFSTAWSRYSTGRMQCEPIDAALDSLVNLGIILHQGQAPANDRDDCLHLLEEMGEKATFDNAYALMKKLQHMRNDAWSHIRFARETYAGWQQDTTRESSKLSCVESVCYLAELLEQLEDLAQSVSQTFNGLMQELWLERYLAERIEPLQQETDMLTEIARKWCPAILQAEQQWRARAAQ